MELLLIRIKKNATRGASAARQSESRSYLTLTGQIADRLPKTLANFDRMIPLYAGKCQGRKHLEFTHFLASAGPTLAKAAEFNSDQQGSRADA